MKKLFLTLISFVMVLNASAKFDTTDFYSEDFIKMSIDSDYPTNGWITYGNGAAPTGAAPIGFFGEGEDAANYVLINAGLNCIAFANTMFEGGVAADQWLITPEIEIPYDNASITFLACGYNANGTLQQMPGGTGKFKVLVSETGTAKEDFTEVLLQQGTVSTKGTDSAEIPTKTTSVSLNGYKGKKVHIAFVVNNTDQVGFVGFTNFVLGQYSLTIDNNLTENVVALGSPLDVKVNFALRTPVVCSSMKASLKVNGELVKEESYTKSFGSQTSNKPVLQYVDFSNVKTIEDATPQNWELTILPDFEGAIPSVLTGTVGVPDKTYPNNVFVEEVTATGCQACTGGIGALEYYGDTYPGGEGKGKFIGAAIHGYINHTDPMSEGVETYLSNFQGFIGTTTYPAAAFNRKVKGVFPSNVSDFERLYAEVAYNSAEITKVEIPENPTDENMIGENIKVHFDVKNGYSTINRQLNAAVILIENNVQGYNSDYSQTNGLVNQTESYVVNNYGSKLLPYLKKFLAGGQYGQGEISFRDIKYQHVARAMAPTFYGEELASEWVSDVAQSFDLDITVPETVMNFDETEAIVIILDNENNRVVASDIMPASKFVKVSGVENVNVASDIVVANSVGNLYVKSAEACVADVYTVDGKHVVSYNVNGELNVAAPATGVLVVKVASNNASKTAKLVF